MVGGKCDWLDNNHLIAVIVNRLDVAGQGSDEEHAVHVVETVDPFPLLRLLTSHINHSAKNCIVKHQTRAQKSWNASRICVSSLRRGHANLLCIVPILVYVHMEWTNAYLTNFLIYPDFRLKHWIYGLVGCFVVSTNCSIKAHNFGFVKKFILNLYQLPSGRFKDRQVPEVDMLVRKLHFMNASSCDPGSDDILLRWHILFARYPIYGVQVTKMYQSFQVAQINLHTYSTVMISQISQKEHSHENFCLFVCGHLRHWRKGGNANSGSTGRMSDHSANYFAFPIISLCVLTMWKNQASRFHGVFWDIAALGCSYRFSWSLLAIQCSARFPTDLSLGAKITPAQRLPKTSFFIGKRSHKLFHWPLQRNQPTPLKITFLIFFWA